MDYEYEVKRARSLTQDDINSVASTMQAMRALPVSISGAVTVTGMNGEPIAEVWWDDESETWLADMEVLKPSDEETL